MSNIGGGGGGGGTPGGLTTQIQRNNASAFGGVTNLTSDGTNITAARLASTASLDWDSGAGAVDLSLFKDAANILSQRNANNAQMYRIFNTGTASNGEWGFIDWATNSNILTIGTAAAGGGTQRALRLVSASATGLDIYLGASHFAQCFFQGFIILGTAANLSFNTDSGLDRVAAKVVAASDGTGSSTPTGWLQTAGYKRVASNFSTGNSAVLADVTGLSAALLAGRTYGFSVYLSLTDAAAGGVQVAMGGNCTVTDLVCDGVLYDNNTVTQGHASALATAIINKTTTATSGLIVKIDGSITVANAGTFTVQLAQNTGNATGTIALRGSWFVVWDAP